MFLFLFPVTDWKYYPNGTHGNFTYLLVDKSSLSKQRRKLISVFEDRQSKVILGTSGIIVIVMFVSYIIFMDIMSLMKTKKGKGTKQNKTNGGKINSATADSYKVSPKETELSCKSLKHQPLLRLKMKM